jgi:hypothetical protein
MTWTAHEEERLAVEWGRAADEADRHPLDDEAWARAGRAYRDYQHVRRLNPANRRERDDG